MIEVSRRDLDRSAPPVVQPLRVLAAEFTAHGANPTDDSVVREPSLLGDGFKSHACCARARDGKQLLLRDNAPRHGRSMPDTSETAKSSSRGRRVASGPQFTVLRFCIRK